MSDPNDVLVRLRAFYTSETCREAADEIERLRKERDEARRKICEIESRGTCDPKKYANLMGWDCYREDSDDR